MKLKKIKLNDSQILSSDSMKFIVGGGDDPLDGGWLPELYVYGYEGYRHTGNPLTCAQCGSQFWSDALEAVNGFCGAACNAAATAVSSRSGQSGAAYAGAAATSSTFAQGTSGVMKCIDDWNYCSSHSGEHIPGSEKWRR